MVKAKITHNVPVSNYRAIDALNYSMLKKFDEDPVKFFEEFKMGKKQKEKVSVAFILGGMVDFYLLECGADEDTFMNRFDEKYAIFDGLSSTKQVFILANTLFEITRDYINDKGEVTVSFDERFREACFKVQAAGKYKGSTKEEMLLDFNDKALDYFEKMLDNLGKQVVDVSLVEKAKFIANCIITDPFTREIFYKNDNVEIINHLVVEWKYALDEKGKFIRCKSEIDRVEINHSHKVIKIMDLKTNYDNEGFDYAYLKYSYYLQAAFYYLAVSYWKELQGGMEDYIIKPMEFIVGDNSSNNRRPLRYATTMNDLINGQYGFHIRNQRYRGTDELVRDIAWAEENNEWRCSKEAYDNNGLMGLKINYD